MNSQPLVSVVIATRNSERYLPKTLESVNAQTYPNVEVITIDKGSIDRTVEIAESFGARSIQQRGTGFAGAWNEGIEMAGGEMIALLDSDDTWVPGKLEAQVRMLIERPELDYAIGLVRHFLEPGMEVPAGFKAETLDVDHVAHMPGALLAWRRVFDEIGPFPTTEDYVVANDIEWFARLKDSGMRTEVADGALTHKRVHDSNVSLFQAKEYNAELMRILRESVARQRAQSSD